MIAAAVSIAGAIAAWSGAVDLPRSVVDLGRVDPPFAEPVHASVPVRNGGDAVVAVERAVPHCAGCTRVAAVPPSIAPGATEEVRLLVEPGRSRGRLRFGATLLASGVPWAVAEVTMLVPGIDAGAAGPIELGGVGPGSALERAIPVRIVAPAGAECDVLAEGSGLRAWLEPESAAPVPIGHGLEERRTRLRLTLEAAQDAPDGPVDAAIELRLRDRDRALDRARLELRAEISRPSSAEPSALFVAAMPDGRARAMDVLLPACGGGAPSAEGAFVMSSETIGTSTRARIRPDAACVASVGAVRQGTVVLRCGGIEHRIPWLGFDLRPDGAPPSAAELARIIAFKRDSIRASTSAYFEETAIAAELLRSPSNAPVPPEGVRIRRWVHRSHDGCVRTTALRREGSADVDVTVSDGRSEARCVGDAEAIVRPDAGGGHALRAEWEAVAGMLGSVARGTARDGLEDLAEALRREPAGDVEIDWDTEATPGRPLLRVGIGRASPLRLWLDPAHGLAVVLREQTVDDGVTRDGVRWEASGFLEAASGIELPRAFRSVQTRVPSPSRAAPGTPQRTVLEQTMRCLAFRIDSPLGDSDRAPERAIGRVRMQALSAWDDGPPRRDPSP